MNDVLCVYYGFVRAKGLSRVHWGEASSTSLNSVVWGSPYSSPSSRSSRDTAPQRKRH